MSVANQVMMPHDVPFDERLFESNSLLKQYWETSVNGRSSMASLNVQRSAEHDDHKHQTLELYNNLVSMTANQESPEVHEAPEVHEPEPEVHRAVAPSVPQAPIPVPRAAGPVMKPKSVSYGLSIVSLILVIVIAVLAASVALYYYNGFPYVNLFGGAAVETVATAIAGGADVITVAPTKDLIQGGASAVVESIAAVAPAAAPAVSMAAGRIARFEL